jgi:hypothetical protein
MSRIREHECGLSETRCIHQHCALKIVEIDTPPRYGWSLQR